MNLDVNFPLTWYLLGLHFRSQQHLLAYRSVCALTAPQLQPEIKLKRLTRTLAIPGREVQPSV